MKTVTVACVLHRRVDKNYKEIAKKLSRVLSTLIEEENAETFLLTYKSSFDYLCLETLTDLKRYYPLIKRVHVSSHCDYAREIDENSLLYYDELFVPQKGSEYYSCKNSYLIMVDKCDILVTYFEDDYKLLKGRSSGTKNAVEYAMKKNKRVINLAE